MGNRIFLGVSKLSNALQGFAADHTWLVANQEQVSFNSFFQARFLEIVEKRSSQWDMN